MQIFIDTANLDEIREAAKLGIVSGVTTNPSLISKNAGGSFKDIILNIFDLVPGPVSAEVTGDTSDEMLSHAQEILNWSKSKEFKNRITIKVPMTVEGIKVVSALSAQGVATNCTLIFNVTQAVLACEAGATYISPFVGRIDDIGHNGIATLQDIVETVRANGYETKIIAASLRHVAHVTATAMIGCDIATIPFGVIKKMYSHPLTNAGLEAFNKDWDSFQK